MGDERLIRLTNLRRLRIEGKPVTALTLSEKFTWGRYTFWRDLLAPKSKKSFGEKLARRIEEDWPLPRGWLDQEHDDVGTAPEPVELELLSADERTLLAAYREIAPERKAAAAAAVFSEAEIARMYRGGGATITRLIAAEPPPPGEAKPPTQVDLEAAVDTAKNTPRPPASGAEVIRRVGGRLRRPRAIAVPTSGKKK